MREVISTDKAPRSKNPLSQAVRMGSLIFVSGQLGKDPASGALADNMAEQTKMCLENLKAILEAAGCTLADVVKTTVFVTKMDETREMNDVYRQYFTQDPPARSCVEVNRLSGGAKVEIEAIAIGGGNKT